MNARKVKNNRLRKWLFHLWDRLTKPSSRLIDAGVQRKSRLLSSFLVLAAIIFMAVAAIRLAYDPQYISYLPQVTINFCITLGVYILSRSRYSLFAAVMTTAIVPIAIINNIYHHPTFPEIEVSLIMLVLSLLLSNLLLPIWGTALFGIINLLIVFLMPSLQPGVIQSFAALNRPFSINLIAAILTVFGFYNRNQIEKDRRENLSKIAEELKHEVSERIRAEEALRKRASRLELISEIGHNTIAIMGIDELLHKAVNLLSAAFGYSNVNLLLVEGDEIVLRAASLQALRSFEGGIRLKIGVEGINGWVAQNGEPLLVNDVSADPRYYAKMPEMQMKSELAVPIQLKKLVIGVLDAQSTELNNFTQEDLETLRAVANQIAIAIENSRLYEAAKAELAERRQAEMALRESEARYRGIVEDQTDMICRFLPNGTITFANEAYCKSLGLTREEIFKMDLLSQVTQENRKQVEANLGKLTVENRVVVDEYRIEKAPGVARWEQWWDRAFFNEDGEIIEYQSVGQDITEQKLAELEIYRLNDELERRVIERTAQLRVTNQELETFAYSVSHDLRAPLRTIDGFSLALLEDYSDSVDEVGKKLLGRIRVASKRMEVLIDGLLKLSRTTRGELRYRMVDLSAIADQIAYELKSSQPERSVEFLIQPDLSAYGDENLLRLVVENLLGNAWKFTRNKEKATVAFGQDVVNDHDAFYVEDDGVGFDMAFAGGLFGAFQRLHSEEEFEGNGIGLATVQRVIHRHGGRVWVEAEVDRGATFFFTLGKEVAP